MIKAYSMVLALQLCLCAGAGAGVAGHGAAAGTNDASAASRAVAAKLLAVRGEAGSLATAAALIAAGGAPRTKAESAKAASAALDLVVKAAEQAPDDPAIAWLHLQLCAEVPACDIRDAATTMRWVDADNGAAWLPTLAEAQKDRDTRQVDRVLADMAAGTRFDLYGDRITVMMFDALKRVRGGLPANYLKADLDRVTEAMELAHATVLPSFSPLINACREAASVERRESCIRLAKTMQRADAVLAQLVGFAVEKRLTSAESRLRSIAERRRLLEWRVAAANISDTPLLPWLRNARARTRLAKMRALPREEDVCIALLHEHGLPLDPPEEHR